MYLLFEIADRDLLFIFLGVVALIILGIVIFYIVTKDKKVMPIAEEERFDKETEIVKEEPKELTEEQKQAKAELERVFNMMSADLEANNNELSVIDDFEREQEENAIISYQELIKQAKAKGQIKNDDFLEEEPLEPVYEEPKASYNLYEESITDDYSYHTMDKQANTEVHTYKVPIHEDEEDNKKFKNSEFISPIFGIQGSTSSYPTVKKMDRTKKEESNEYETDENTQFLNSLKEFRENL